MMGPHLSLQFSSVQFSSSVVSDCLGPHGLQGARPPVHHQLPESTQTQVHRVGDAIQPSHHLSSTSLPPSIFPSTRVFSNESALPIGWPKCWSFRFNVSPSNEYSGLISFMMDWLDLLAVQGKGLSRVFSNTTVQKHQFFGAQLSSQSTHDYWNNHSLD